MPGLNIRSPHPASSPLELARRGGTKSEYEARPTAGCGRARGVMRAGSVVDETALSGASHESIHTVLEVFGRQSRICSVLERTFVSAPPGYYCKVVADAERTWIKKETEERVNELYESFESNDMRPNASPPTANEAIDLQMTPLPNFARASRLWLGSRLTGWKRWSTPGKCVNGIVRESMDDRIQIKIMFQTKPIPAVPIL